MKKHPKVLLALLALLVCLNLASCGNSNTDSINDEPNDDSVIDSVIDDPNEGLGGDESGTSEDAVNDVSAYTGIWLGEAENDYDSIEIDADGNWKLFYNGDVADEGYLRYEPEWGAVYAFSRVDDSGSRTAIQNGKLYITSFGYFNYGEDMVELWYESEPSGDGTAWHTELYQHDAADFEGVWYHDGDLAALTYLVIDADGNWSYYQRAPGAEPEEMDYGIFSYSTDEASVYYADSALYDGVSVRVFELDDDALVWGDEGTYYLMEQ